MSRKRLMQENLLLKYSEAVAICGELLLDDDEEEELCLKTKRSRSCWVSEWLLKRPKEGVSDNLINELRYGSEIEKKLFKDFHRFSDADFDFLHDLVAPLIRKKDTNMRNAIPTKMRLELTLHFLAHGDSYSSMQFKFRIPQCTISKIIPETLEAIYTILAPTYLKTPQTVEEWEEVAQKFKDYWNFPHCLGALDGKHVTIMAPPNAGSVFFNYKKTHSIVLMGICDASYKFLYIDVGCNGREADGGVFNKCTFFEAMQTGILNFPTPRPLSGREINVPFSLIADDAFALRSNVMKPYPGQLLPAVKRIYNYRLSRARRTIENAYGILSSKFRLLRTTINLDAQKAKLAVKAACVLHNFLMIRSGKSYAPPHFVDTPSDDGTITEGAWRNEGTATNLLNLESHDGRDRNVQPNAIRDEVAEYFITPTGEVPWQFRYI